jgi:hypothetical protein
MSNEKEPQKIVSEILTLLDGQSNHMCQAILDEVKEKLKSLCVLDITRLPVSQPH